MSWLHFSNLTGREKPPPPVPFMTPHARSAETSRSTDHSNARTYGAISDRSVPVCPASLSPKRIERIDSEMAAVRGRASPRRGDHRSDSLRACLRALGRLDRADELTAPRIAERVEGGARARGGRRRREILRHLDRSAVSRRTVTATVSPGPMRRRFYGKRMANDTGLDESGSGMVATRAVGGATIRALRPRRVVLTIVNRPRTPGFESFTDKAPKHLPAAVFRPVSPHRPRSRECHRRSVATAQ